MADDLIQIASNDYQLSAGLTAAKLPASDLGKENQVFWRLGAPDSPRGYVGIETYGNHALLRSLLITPGHREAGNGRALVDAAIEHAQTMGIDEVWLLTNTAAGLFERLGWVRRHRGDAPKPIAACEEFASLCPSTSACFSLRIRTCPD